MSSLAEQFAEQIERAGPTATALDVRPEELEALGGERIGVPEDDPVIWRYVFPDGSAVIEDEAGEWSLGFTLDELDADPELAAEIEADLVRRGLPPLAALGMRVDFEDDYGL